MSILLFRRLSAWHRMHHLWCCLLPLGEEEVLAYGSLIRDFPGAWGAMGWGSTPWVDWVSAHSFLAVQQWRTLAIFSYVPVEHLHQCFKRDCTNTCLG